MLCQKFRKHMEREQQTTSHGFALVALAILLLWHPPADSQQYVIVESENGDRLTGTWRDATDTHFRIEYKGQVLRLPLAGHTLNFISDLGHVPDRTAAKYFHNGLTLLELGLPEKARGRFEAAIEEFPRYPEAHYQLGLLYKADGDTVNALERFRSAVILDASRFDLVPVFYELGDAALANEAYDVAADNYQLILTYYPEHSGTSVLKYLTGFLLVEQLENYNVGLALLEAAIKDHPDMAGHEKALYLIGKLQAETGELEKALHTLNGFVLRYPESEWIYEAYLTRASVNLQLGNLEATAMDAHTVNEMTEDIEIQERAKHILDETRWKVYTDADGLPDNQTQVLATQGTRLWVGTPTGVMLFETADDRWIPIPVVAQLINTALENVPDVTTIAASPQGVWIGTRFQGAIHYNQLTGEIQNYSPANGALPAQINDIKMDEAEIWFATDTGVIRKIKDSPDPFLHYNVRNSFLPAEDIQGLLLTPAAVWGTSTEGQIVVFDRGREAWDSYNSTSIREGMQFVGLQRAEDQLLFTWFNVDEKSNGYFQADMDGGNGKSTTLHTGIENEDDLRSIYISGALDTSPIPEETPEVPPIEEMPDPDVEPFPTEEASEPETEGVEFETDVLDLEPPLVMQTPLVLWIATNHHLYTHHTRAADVWQDTTTPRILTGEFVIRALTVIDNRVWLATSNGLATVKSE